MKNNEERLVQPKVYTLLIESDKNFFLSVQYTYSLEEAFYLARLEFASQNPKRNGLPNTLDGAKINLFSIKTVEALNEGLAKIPTGGDNQVFKIKEDPADDPIDDILNFFDKMSPKDLIKGQKKDVGVDGDTGPVDKSKLSKNDLMKQIIDNKDIGLFNKNKHLFTSAEKKYIKGHLI